MQPQCRLLIRAGIPAIGLRSSHWCWSCFSAAVPRGDFWGVGSLRQEVGKVAPASTIPQPTTVAAAESASLPGPIPKQSSPEQDEGLPAIVVLPFQDLTGDRAESDLGKGIAEAFTTDLATFPEFQVISSTSAFAYAGGGGRHRIPISHSWRLRQRSRSSNPRISIIFWKACASPEYRSNLNV